MDVPRRDRAIVGRRALVFLFVFLLLGQPVEGGGAVVGIITRASAARIASGSVSAGATIYDGVSRSTGDDGLLQLRSAAALLSLFRQSRITIHAAGNGERVDLSAGSLIFSTSAAEAVEIQAEGAQIRPATNVATVAEVRILGANRLKITASRGALAVSFRGENRMLLEGQLYLITLDASAAAPVADSGDRPHAPMSRPER